jgi:hypothetical protein
VPTITAPPAYALGWGGAAQTTDDRGEGSGAAYACVPFDATTRLGTAADPDALFTFRSPRFDLDSLDWSGPVDEPFQYDQARQPPGTLLQTATGETDLPRNAQASWSRNCPK